MRFKKKPVIVDAEPVAELIDAAFKHWKELPTWVSEAQQVGKLVFAADAIHVQTLEGTMRAEPSDWLIRGTRGELYPCKPGPFADTFERTE